MTQKFNEDAHNENSGSEGTDDVNHAQSDDVDDEQDEENQKIDDEVDEGGIHDKNVPGLKAGARDGVDHDQDVERLPKILGCSKCRFSKKGCLKCRKDDHGESVLKTPSTRTNYVASKTIKVPKEHAASCKDALNSVNMKSMATGQECIWCEYYKSPIKPPTDAPYLQCRKCDNIAHLECEKHHNEEFALLPSQYAKWCCNWPCKYKGRPIGSMNKKTAQNTSRKLSFGK